MKTHTVKELLDIITDKAYKKTLVEKSGVSNDKMTRLSDERNGGRLVDLIEVLNAFDCQLQVSHNGNVYPVKVGD